MVGGQVVARSAPPPLADLDRGSLEDRQPGGSVRAWPNTRQPEIASYHLQTGGNRLEPGAGVATSAPIGAALTRFLTPFQRPLSILFLFKYLKIK